MQKKRRRSDVRSAATPLRRGRRIMVWQTRVLMDDGTLIAVAIQTQMVL
jgi:1,4-dihydroxy-2-naphthoyl-CoA hydrolase